MDAVAQYNLFLTADGTFALNLFHADGTVTNVAPRTASTAINKGEVSNHLTVLCRGNQITLAINGQTVGAYAGTLSEPGAIGLYVANPANAAGPVGMEAGFKNLRISALAGADVSGASLSRELPVLPVAAPAMTSAPEWPGTDRPRRAP